MGLILGRKSQSSVELLVVFAIGLSALLAFFALSQDKISETRTGLALSEAKETVELLSKAADSVYSEGANSTRKVYVTIPEGTNLSRSSISGNSIVLSVNVPGGVTDVSARASETVFGTWPALPGSYNLIVTSYEGAVGIGTATLQITPLSLYAEMGAFSSIEKNISIRNFGVSPVSISGELFWSESDVTFENKSTLSFLLPSGGETNLTFQINSSFAAVGSYLGALDLSGGGEEYSIPITVHVSGSEGTGSTANVSYIVVETFKNSSCDTEKLIFDGPDNTTISGEGWPSGTYLSLSIFNSTGSIVQSANPIVNSTGGFSYAWSPAGFFSGEYSANVSDPISSNSARGVFFTVSAC